MNILSAIVAARRASLSRFDATRPAESRAAVHKSGAHRLAAALKRLGGPHVIAEIKAASPSAGPIIERVDAAALAAKYRDAGAAAISVVTEPEFFRGSLDWVALAGTAGLPVLMKDFIIDERQIDEAIAAGADALLLIAAILSREELRHFIALIHSRGRDALVEVHDEVELSEAVGCGAGIIGVNNRDLRTFTVDLATSERLARTIPTQILRVSESGIRSGDDLERLRHAGFDGCLIGESLLRAADPGAALEQLISNAKELRECRRS